MVAQIKGGVAIAAAGPPFGIFDIRFREGAYMNEVSGIELYAGTYEERLPGYTADFPCITSRVALDRIPNRVTPWHWHKALELFCVQSGALEYSTPRGSITFLQGSAGLVNSNVLHRTRTTAHVQPNVQLLHLFDPDFVAGGQGSRIDKRYVEPIITARNVELLALEANAAACAPLLEKIHATFYGHFFPAQQPPMSNDMGGCCISCCFAHTLAFSFFRFCRFKRLVAGGGERLATVPGAGGGWVLTYNQKLKQHGAQHMERPRSLRLFKK